MLPNFSVLKVCICKNVDNRFLEDYRPSNDKAQCLGHTLWCPFFPSLLFQALSPFSAWDRTQGDSHFTVSSKYFHCSYLVRIVPFQCREDYPWWDFLDNKRKANIDMLVFLVQNSLAWGISQEGAKWTEYYLRAKLQELKGLSTMKENIEQGSSTSPSGRSTQLVISQLDSPTSTHRWKYFWCQGPSQNVQSIH